MTDLELIAAHFEEHRPHLRGVAYRMLGSTAAADDAVQEAWLRLAGADHAVIINVRGWLTTVVSRICLDVLRTRTTKREELVDEAPDAARPPPAITPPHLPAGGADPAGEAELADSVSAALLVVLDRLSPSERLAFVLQDVFAVPFEEIGTILDRSPAAAKQLASRARIKVRGARPTGATDLARQRRVVEAFLRAARHGDLAGLVAVLDPEIVLDADGAAARMGAPAITRGAAEVAAMFSGRALGADLAQVDGHVGLAWIVNGGVKVAWNFYIDGDRVVHIDMHADPALLDALAIAAVL
jgi:RNA polymerase sigma factor (sigma-70 family)